MRLHAMLAVSFLMIAAMFGGCTNLSAVSAASEIATLEVIGHQPKEKQKPIAQAAVNVATAVSQATQTSPDLTTVKSYTRPVIAAEIAKLAPADALVVEMLADTALDAADAAYVNTFTAATSTDKGKLAQSIAQAALKGIVAGANLILHPSSPPTLTVPPATQPGG